MFLGGGGTLCLCKYQHIYTSMLLRAQATIKEVSNRRLRSAYEKSDLTLFPLCLKVRPVTERPACLLRASTRQLIDQTRCEKHVTAIVTETQHLTGPVGSRGSLSSGGWFSLSIFLSIFLFLCLFLSVPLSFFLLSSFFEFVFPDYDLY